MCVIIVFKKVFCVMLVSFITSVIYAKTFVESNLFLKPFSRSACANQSSSKFKLVADLVLLKEHLPKMRNLSLLQRWRCLDLPIPGSPQCFAIRSDAGTVLVASELSITEYNPRTGEVQ